MARTEEIIKTVPEEGTAIFRVVCKDELGALVTPVTLAWDLTALDGSVIAYNQVVAVLNSTMYIPVYGTNLRILENEDSFGERLITFRGTYNSTNGSGLPLHKQVKFKVQNLKLIGYPLSITAIDVIFTDDLVAQVA
jgi:hypothetical protein